MADRLTQLQDCLDDLATQMFASVRYIQSHHAYAPVEGQPDMNPHSATSANPASTNANANANTSSNGVNGTTQAQNEAQGGGPADEPIPDPPEVFRAALRELARDLIIKEQQIEYLISVLPGIGQSEANQSARIRELETELRDAEKERKAAMQDRDDMLNVLGDLAAQCKRVY